GENPGAWTTYEYDGQGQRIQAHGGNATQEDWYFNAAGQVVERVADCGPGSDTLDEYVWSARNIGAQVLQTQYFDSDDDGSFADETGGTWYIVQDANNNVTAHVLESGLLITRFSYDGYGNMKTYTPTWTELSLPSNPMGIYYAGYWLDDASGLYFVGPRVYSSSLGRWLQEDPIGYGDSNDLYEYCRSNPINGTDPTGMASLESLKNKDGEQWQQGSQLWVDVWGTDNWGIGTIESQGSDGGWMVRTCFGQLVPLTVLMQWVNSDGDHSRYDFQLLIPQVELAYGASSQLSAEGRQRAVMAGWDRIQSFNESSNAAYWSGYREGAAYGLKGGSSILANTLTFGGTDALGWTDSESFQGTSFTVSRVASVVAREAIITALTLGTAQIARGGVQGASWGVRAINYVAQSGKARQAALYAYQGLQAVNVARSGYSVGEGIIDCSQGRPGAGALKIVGGALGVTGSLTQALTAPTLNSVLGMTRLKPGALFSWWNKGSAGSFTGGASDSFYEGATLWQQLKASLGGKSLPDKAFDPLAKVAAGLDRGNKMLSRGLVRSIGNFIRIHPVQIGRNWNSGADFALRAYTPGLSLWIGGMIQSSD
ncbi:MAG: RHS repeat-associated core domain-containing protein, partial [Phycisphaerae bacterium]